MAKKSRRARRRTPQVARPVRISDQSPTLDSGSASKEVNFAQEYHYVIEDLRRIAIIAAALLVLLVALALLLS